MSKVYVSIKKRIKGNILTLKISLFLFLILLRFFRAFHYKHKQNYYLQSRHNRQEPKDLE